MRHSPGSRDRALLRLRRWRQALVVVAVAACFGFTALAARSFPGRPRSTRPAAAPSAPRVVRHHHRRRRHHHHHASRVAAPAPTDQQPVVASGGS